MPQNHVELAGLFQSVTQALKENQQALNQTDEYNQNHGDNMVQTFETITRALQEKQGKTDSAALSYAARKLAHTTKSKSGQLYAQNLAQAAAQFKGKAVDERGAMDLLQTLIGGGQAPQVGGAGGDILGALLGGSMGSAPATPQPGDASGDILGALLGGMTGGQQPQAPSGAQAPSGDILGALLGGLAGGETAPAQSGTGSSDLLGSLLGGLSGNQSASAGLSDGLDVGDLLTAGMAFFQAKQSGGSTMQALVQAFMAVSGMGRSADRSQSTSLVISSFLQALGSTGSQR